MMSTDMANKMKVVSVFVFIGFLMTIGIAIGTITNPAGGQFHEATDPQSIINDLTASTTSELQARLLGIAIDNFFIVGYIAIFYGIYLLVRETDGVFSGIGFALGLTTGFCDIIENAVHVALINGIPAGWNPDPIIFVELWTATFIKDITSYMAGLIFVVLLLLSTNSPVSIRGHKIVLAILVAIYVGLGSVALVIPSVLTIRNLSFMIDMGIGSYLLYSISRKSDLNG